MFDLKVGQILVENSTRIRYTIIYKSIDLVTVVGNYSNAVPRNEHLAFVTENFEVVEGGA